MPFFTRNISITLDEREDGVLIVSSRLADGLHDITVNLYVSRPHLTISDAEVEMTRVPQAECRLIYPVAKKLIGLTIGRGFNRNVAEVLGGGGGCPNVLNLVLVSAPLAINFADPPGRRKDGEDGREGDRGRHNTHLKGLCIANPAG